MTFRFVTDRQVGQIRCEDVLTVTRTVHPRVDYEFGKVLTSGDVLGQHAILDLEVSHQVSAASVYWTIVTHETMLRHVPRLFARNRPEFVIPNEGIESVLESLLVGQIEHFSLKLLSWRHGCT